jgi:hypothetical protein
LSKRSAGAWQWTTGVAAFGLSALIPLTACSSVLGLDAPSLDPCEHGCADDASTFEAGSDAANPIDSAGDDAAPPADATPDRGPVVGVRCGPASNGAACGTSAPTCCQIDDDAGGATYACRAGSSSCEGYPIGCASNADCSGSDVCCHSSTAIKCVKSSSCANDALVCEPNGPTDQCPAGWTCKAVLTNDGVPSPYMACAP